MLRVITFNVRGFPAMRKRNVNNDLRRVKGEADLYCWQEFWNLWYVVLLRAIFRRREGWRHATTGIAGVGVTYNNKRFQYMWAFNKKLHGKVPTFCAKRKMRGVVLRDKQTGKVVVVISTHFTPGRSRRTKKREAAMREGFRNLSRFINHHVKMGRTVIVGMDANEKRARVRDGLGVTAPGNVPIRIKSHDIDHVVIAGRVEIQQTSTYSPRLIASDHLPFRVKFRIR